MTIFSGDTSILDPAGPVNKATVRDDFMEPVANDINLLLGYVEMVADPFLATEVDTTARALVRHNGVTKSMTLPEILKASEPLRPYVSAQDLLLAGDGVTDDAPALQRGYDTYEAAGGAVFMLRALPGQSFYFKGSPRGGTNISTIFFSPHTVTRTARISLAGSLAFDPTATGMLLLADAAQGGTTFTVNTSPAGGGALSTKAAVGDSYWLTGQLDSCGTALQSQLVRITGVNSGTNTLTIGDPLSFAFEEAYAAGDYEEAQGFANKTLISKVIAARASGNVAAGSTLFPIEAGDIGKLQEGDYVMVHDEKLCSDIAGANNSNINIEMARIAPSISGDSSATLRLNRSVERSYTTAFSARLIKISPIINSSIEGGTVEFTEAPGANNFAGCFEMEYAVDCALANCNVPNTDNFGTRDNAFRAKYSLSCRIENCTARGARYVDSGDGNGAVLAWATDCHVVAGNYDGMRHAVQFLGATNCTATGVTIQNPAHTPMDYHGANEVGCIAYDCTMVGGPTYEQNPGRSPHAITLGNSTLLAGSHRCGFVGGRVRGFKDPTNTLHEPCIKLFPPSTGCFVRGTEFSDIGHLFKHEDVAGFGALVSSGHRITDVSVDGCASFLIDINSRENGAINDTLTDMQINDCTFRNINKMCRAVYVTELQMQDNIFDEITPDDTAPYVLLASNITGLDFTNNTWHGSKNGVHFTSCTSIRVVDNKSLDQTTATWFHDNGGNTGTVSSNAVVVVNPAFTTGGSLFTIFPAAIGIFAIADDTVYTFIPRHKSGVITVWTNAVATVFAHVQYIAGSTAATALIAGLTTGNVAVTTGILAGTTGTDTKFTISAHTNGQIYLENRTGGSLNIEFSVN